VSSANFVRELVNCTNAQTVSPYPSGCVYTPGRCSACSWALFTACLRTNRFNLYYWYLIFFSSGGFHALSLLHFPLLLSTPTFPLPHFQRPVASSETWPQNEVKLFHSSWALN